MPEVAASRASIKSIKHTLQDLPLRLLFSVSPPIRSLLDISCHPFQALCKETNVARGKGGERETGRERDGDGERKREKEMGRG